METDNTIIRRATADDVKGIMKFIKSYWSESHILANHIEFFEYEFQCDDYINFIISINKENNITAMIGYITYGYENSDIMTVMWKSIDQKSNSRGIELLNYLTKQDNIKTISTCGNNEKVIPFYKYLGFNTGKLYQYYRISNKKKYQIAMIKEKIILPYSQTTKYSLLEINSFNELKDKFDFITYKDRNPKPYKEPWYIEKRYFKHPIYEYKTYIIVDDNNIADTVLFARIIDCNSVKILRVIDCIGKYENLQYISYDIQRLIDKNQYEYIDFYQFGISDDIMKKAGFILNDGGENIIPNYFEPYLQKNIDINFSTQYNSDFVLFKGDGDQDRPSKI